MLSLDWTRWVGMLSLDWTRWVGMLRPDRTGQQIRDLIGLDGLKCRKLIEIEVKMG